MSVGDVIHIPAGEKHWHGGRKESCTCPTLKDEAPVRAPTTTPLQRARALASKVPVDHRPLTLSLSKGGVPVVRQAHHERDVQRGLSIPGATQNQGALSAPSMGPISAVAELRLISRSMLPRARKAPYYTLRSCIGIAHPVVLSAVSPWTGASLSPGRSWSFSRLLKKGSKCRI